jgi:hypothetical protein
MKKFLLGLLSLVTVVALISCGGGGNSQLSQTGRSVQLIQRLSFLSMCNSGIGFMGFGGGTSGGTSGGTTGTTTGGNTGGGGFSSIGGYVRYFGGGRGRALAIRTLGGGTTGGTTGGSGLTTGGTEGGTDGGTTGGGGGTGGEYFYYDEWLQLWVDTQWSENTFSSLFYEDEAKTLPAGHITSTFAGSWETFPQTYTNDYVFTAGSMAGASGTYNCTQVDEFNGSMVYNDTYADGSHDLGSAHWNEIGSNWEWRWDGAHGEWYQDSGEWTNDGAGTYSCSNSEGWSSVWHYNPDWSGSAHFEGPDPLLPADMTWTSAGHYRIVYADGSVEEWSWEDLWGGGGGESNTTGMGGTGTTGETTTGTTGGTSVSSTGGTSSSTGGGTSSTGTVGGTTGG